MRPILIIAFVSSLGGPLSLTYAESTATDAERMAPVPMSAGTLIVNVEGLQSSDGSLRFVMFDSKDNFLNKAVRADVVEIAERKGTWTVEKLPYGVYAVLVHHDIDGSGAMERHWYGKPKEPTGTSNDAPAKFGPPKFRKAKFTFESPTLVLTIRVK